MRIVVNDIAASMGGAMTVLKDFYKCVCENDRENEWIFLLSDKYFEETENVKIITLPDIKKSAVKKVFFDFFKGKKFIKKLNPDVVFSMQNIITFGLKIPQAVYVHQSLPFQSVKKFSFLKSSERNLAIKQFLVGSIIKASIKKADKIIVQTDWMKDAVCKSCKVRNDKVVKILPNVKDLSQFIDHSSYDRKYFFYPTSEGLYKNNNLLVEACRLLNKESVDFNAELTIGEGAKVDGVNYIGRIAYEDVISKYNKSTLVFPSYIETFGYPLAEARQMGTIVLAADTLFARELLDGYKNAYFFDPFKPEQLAELMKKVLSGEIVREETEKVVTEIEDCWVRVLKVILECQE